MLTLQGITYAHANKNILFADLNFSIAKQNKAALIGNNGSGKSTLLKIMSGDLPVLNGHVKAASKPYYVPQILDQFNGHTVAEALGVADRLTALKAILDGHVTERNLELLNDDWTLEERCKEAFSHWQIDEVLLEQKMDTLSGGQKTKVFLAGITIHQPEIVLLDEPSNHLDVAGRSVLYDYIKYTTHTLVVVSHDRTLLNLLDVVFELDKRGVTAYGGNYDFYVAQKEIERNAQSSALKNAEKTLRKAKETERETMERQQKLDARGKKKQENAGLPTIAMNTFRNSAEKSTARVKATHDDKIAALSKELNDLRKDVPDIDRMKMDLFNSVLHAGKTLVTAEGINFAYAGKLLWRDPLNFSITSGERIVVRGANGSGKTTLVKMALGELAPGCGSIYRTAMKATYIEQDYSLIDDTITVYGQALRFNAAALPEHEIKIRLTRFLFTKDFWDRPCKELSGGEKMRLVLCSLTISNQTPDIIVMDEPTNNLDILNTEILTAAINEYRGTILVISHDEYFLKQINVTRSIAL